MGVELGVAGPARAVPKRCSDEPLGLDQLGAGMAPAGVGGFFGEVIENGGDGPIVGDRHRLTELLGTEGPQQRDALGGRERQVVARAAAWLDLESQRFPLGRGSSQQVPQSLGFDLANQPELFSSCPDRLSGRFTSAQVIVVDVVGHLVEVVVSTARRTEPPYREHGDAD